MKVKGTQGSLRAYADAIEGSAKTGSCHRHPCEPAEINSREVNTDSWTYIIYISIYACNTERELDGKGRNVYCICAAKGVDPKRVGQLGLYNTSLYMKAKGRAHADARRFSEACQPSL